MDLRYSNKYKRSIDPGTAARLLILAEMLWTAENPLPTIEEDEEEEEDEDGISAQ